MPLGQVSKQRHPNEKYQVNALNKAEKRILFHTHGAN